MKVIVGLGNPGKKYDKTKHNAGFFIIDELLKRHSVTLDKQKFKADYAIEFINGEKVMFVKPQTFMNLSGQALRPLMDYYNAEIKDLVVVYDDLDLPTGKIRLRQTGGHGGHNGIRSLIEHLGTKEFNRIRVGIGRPTNSMAVVDYVLRPFSKEQSEDIAHSVLLASDACEYWLEHTFLETMNKYN